MSDSPVASASSRFSNFTSRDIDEAISGIKPKNTVRSQSYVWKQFNEFLLQRGYELNSSTSNEQIAVIMKDWAFNMKKIDGNEYKETVVKVIWNSTAKQLEEMYYKDYGRKLNLFSDVQFFSARLARDAKRKALQSNLESRKRSSVALTEDEYDKIKHLWGEDSPSELQKKFFCIAAYELCWRGGEGVHCRMHYFKEEIDNLGNVTGRLEYNPLFSKTQQGGAKNLPESKFLVSDAANSAICPVRLFKKIIAKRPKHVTTDRLFLTPNPGWMLDHSNAWYKNCPVGQNEMGKWMKSAANAIGIDTNSVKITNHSLRSTAVSQLARKGVGETQLIKMSGHSSITSLKPYLQLDKDHHKGMVLKLRGEQERTDDADEAGAGSKHEMKSIRSDIVEELLTDTTASSPSQKRQNQQIYNNCVFHCNSMNM